jgi:hypothetical protein
VDKCIQQLVDRAARNTVLRAKKIVLQFVCRDYCKMPYEELNKLHNKEKLYAAATAWVRVQWCRVIIWSHVQLGRKKCHSSGRL